MGCASSTGLSCLEVIKQTFFVDSIFEGGAKVSLVAGNSFTASLTLSFIELYERFSGLDLEPLEKLQNTLPYGRERSPGKR